jgi:hypothetical protein
MQIILIRGSKLRKNKKKQTNEMKTIVSNRSEQVKKGLNQWNAVFNEFKKQNKIIHRK